MVDVNTPAPGPWRMPTDNERRCRIYFQRSFRDCVDVCEVNPDLEETTDATMRVIVAAPELLAACDAALAWFDQRTVPGAEDVVAALRAAVGRAQRGRRVA
jgi:hypothetical protein